MFCSTTVVHSIYILPQPQFQQSLHKYSIAFIRETEVCNYFSKIFGKKSFEFVKFYFENYDQLHILNTINGCLFLFLMFFLLQNKTLQPNRLFNFPSRQQSCFCHLVGKSEAVPLIVIHSFHNSSSGLQFFLQLFYFQNLSKKPDQSVENHHGVLS